MLKKSFLNILLSYILLCMWVSCQDYSPIDVENAIAVKTRNSAWNEIIGGESNPAQKWITGYSYSLDVKTSESAKIRVYSIEQPTRYIYAQEMVDGESTINFTIPQNSDKSFGVEYRSSNDVFYRCIDINNELEQKVTLDFSKIETRATHSSGDNCNEHEDYMCNADAKGISGYNSYAPWTWKVMAEALEERKLPKKDLSATNFRLVSKGKFYISMLYGYTGTADNCYLGYYYYTGDKDENLYTDVKFVELCEVLNEDYYLCNGEHLAKVRYKLSSDYQWHDASFDHYSQPDRSAKNNNKYTIWRKAHGNHNTNYLLNTYYNANTHDIDIIKGLSFCVDAPVDSHLGFYLLRTNPSNTYDKDHLLRQKYIEQNTTEKFNTNSYVLKDNFVMAFVDADQNYYNPSKKLQYYAAVSRYNGYTFIGLDDNPTSGSDHDSNDVTFAITAGIDGVEPEVELPDIVVYDKDEEKYYNEDGTKTDEPKPSSPLVEWTIGYEDMGSELDFDFNDVVISVTPNPANATAKVVLKAASGTIDAELHFDGPNGDVNFGEVHELLGGGRKINGGSSPTREFVDLGNVQWVTGSSMANDAQRFYILVKQEGKTPRRVDVSTSCNADGTSNAPEAICVASDTSGAWQWPLEGISIVAAYPNIGEWAKDVSKDNNEWYKLPVEGKVINLK